MFSQIVEFVKTKKELSGLDEVLSVMRRFEKSDVGEGEIKKKETKGFEGLGELTLQMLDRYKIDNIVICIVIKDFNQLRAVETKNFEGILGKLKEFLLELYSSLIEFKIINPEKNFVATHKHFDLPLPKETEEEKRKKAILKREKGFIINPAVLPKVSFSNHRPEKNARTTSSLMK